MKKFLLVFCTVTMVLVLTVFAYNSEKGPAKLKDGITELPQPQDDSLVKRGRSLVDQQNYTDQDLQAIAAYLNNR